MSTTGESKMIKAIISFVCLAASRIARLGVFVASMPDFGQQPQVSGASDLMTAVFGDRGRHARAAVSCAALLRGATVKVEANVELGRSRL
jgi:enamine deaminase RidA (YjgF/YER057c/UK114 family)